MSYWEWWQVDIQIPAWQLVLSITLAFFLGGAVLKFRKDGFDVR